MKNNKILRYFLVGILLLFFIHQVYSAIFNPVKTQTAEYAEVVDGISVHGMVIREESVVVNSSPGVYHFEVFDGERVSNGGTVAEIYESASSSYTVSRIEEINEQIKDMEELQSYNSVIASDLSLADAKVNEALSDLIISCRGGDFSHSGTLTHKLTSAISRRQIITGEQTDFSARINELKQERDSLNATLPATSGQVSAPMSGYFLTHVDGYETVFADKKAEDLTPELLDSAKPDKIPENTIGKIVSGYEWMVVAKIPIGEIQNYSAGDELSIHTSVNGGTDLPVTVKAINMSKERDEATIVLSCGSVSQELASTRFCDFTIVNNVYTGLKIAKSALRIIDSKTGVYIKNGGMLEFVPVKVIYAEDDYIICEKNNSNESALRLYDDVVIKGKKLYDGKVVS